MSLVLPAATKQWSDRQQQHELKADLTSRLAAAVASATTNGGFVLANQLQAGASADETRAAFENALTSWKREASAIDAVVAGYFATTRDPTKDNLVVAFRAYIYLVQDYIGFCTYYRGLGSRQAYLHYFETNLQVMRRHVRGVPAGVIPTTIAKSGTERALPRGFRDQAQNVWAQNIVNASAPLIAIIGERQPRGLEVGAGAFLRQIIHTFG